MSDYQQRFGGISRLYGIEDANRLRQAHVCIVGIGGVGSWAAEAITRSGVGTVTLIDLDDICTTNTNRQIQAMTSTIGKMKIDVMAERMQLINPEITVHAIHDFLTIDTIASYITAQYDVLIDCIDNVKSKAAIINACKRSKIPVITAGGAGGQIDPTRITAADLAKATNDPLLAKVKSTLRREYGFAKGEKSKFGVECIFSTESLKYPQPDGTVCAQKTVVKEGESMKLDCNQGFGASVMVTGCFGFFTAARAIASILKKNTA